MSRGPIDPTGQWKDPVRPVDMNFVAGLRLLDREQRPLPGATITRVTLDPRLNANPMLIGGQSAGPKATSQVVLYRSLARIQHDPTRTTYLAYVETMDALLLRQQDPEKYPRWLMMDPVKATELQVRFGIILRKPQASDDRAWLGSLPDDEPGDRAFDALSYFLQKEGVFQPTMFGKS